MTAPIGCHQAREQAALALLARQAPDQDTARHLADCPACAQEADRLTPMPGLLDLVRDPALRHPEAPDSRLLERLIGQVRRRRRVRRTVLVAAAAVAVAVPAGWTVLHERPESPPVVVAGAQPVLVRSADDPATGVWAKVELRRAAWGSDLTFDIGGVPAGTRCRLLAVTRSGRTEVAGSWTATAARSWTVHGSVAAEADQITAIQLVDDASGRVLLPVTLV